MADMMQILIVDDNERTRDGTERLLEYEENVEVVGFAENGQEAIEKVKELKPHIVLMDINMPVMDGLTATEHIKHQHPEVQIIIVSVQDDAHYMDEAFDFVAKPISSRDLLRTMMRAHQQYKRSVEATQIPATPTDIPAGPYMPGMGRPPGKDGHVFAVLGMKGGVGKTTVAVNLGVGLARSLQNKKVVVVDTNILFGDVGVFLNTRGEYSVADLADMAADPSQLEVQTVESILLPHESGVKLLVAPTQHEDLPPIGFDKIKNLLNFLKGEFDFVIVDTGTALDEVAIAVIQSADRMIVVTEPTMPSLKDTRLLFTQLQGIDTPMELIILVLNKVDPNNRITPDQISNFLKHKVDVQIPDDPWATTAVNQSAPLILQDSKRAAAVRPLINLVKLVSSSVSQAQAGAGPVPQQEEAKKTGFLPGIFG
jgi:pilus assembly protein CpaE